MNSLSSSKRSLGGRPRQQPPPLGVYQAVLTPDEKHILKKLIVGETWTTKKQVCDTIRNTVTPAYRDDANRFCDAYIAIAPYFTQASNITQFKADGTRKHCGSSDGPMYPTAKQEETVRHVLSTPCSGIWSNYKVCGLLPPRPL
jgi:hypothetical protein